MSKATMLTLLQNAVHGISELRIVKEQGDQLNVHSNQALTYDQYVPLLKSAAQSYDRKFQRHKMSTRSRRIVRTHEVTNIDDGTSEDDEELALQAEFHDAQGTLDGEEFWY